MGACGVYRSLPKNRFYKMKILRILLTLLSLFSVKAELQAKEKAALAVLVSNPNTRVVKKRLAQDFNPAIASRYYAFCLDILGDDLEKLEQDFDIFICPYQEEMDTTWSEQRWPQYDVLTVPQGRHMGDKIERVANAVLERGYSQVLIIGSNSPSLPLFHIHQCQDLLTGGDVVLGPTEDGSCYLLGTRRPLARIEGVDWTSFNRLNAIHRSLNNKGYTVVRGPKWYTVSTAEQLWKLKVDLVGSRGKRAQLLSWIKTLPQVAVVIPVLNERWRIAQLIEALQRLDPRPEILFVDRGSRDGTVGEIYSQGQTPIVRPGASRGVSFNAGILQAQAPILLCLRPDSALSQEAYQAMRDQMSETEISGGAFAFSLQNAEEDWRKRFVEGMTTTRNKLFHMPYGDQGYFVRKSALEKVGLFRDMPVLEDVEWFGRLKDTGKYKILDQTLSNSGKQTFERGWVRTGLINATVLTLYKLGVDPAYFAKWYGDEDGIDDEEGWNDTEEVEI